MASISWAAAVVVVAILAALVLIAFKMLAVRRSMSSASVQAVAPATSPADPIDVAPPFKLVRSRHGWMLVNPNDAYMGQAILAYGECCEIEVAFLLRWISARPGLVIEVGTNIGTHTLPLAKALAAEKRQLIAFEPQPVIFQNLCANLALNAVANTVAWPFACSDQPGRVYFSRPDYSSGGNFGGVSMTSEPMAGSVAVPCVTLDTMVESDAVSLMKIDVEGFELRVLQGAREIIERSRPVLYVENDRPDRSEALIEWLWSARYRLWWHVPMLFNPANFFGNVEDRYERVASINMLCVPREFDMAVGGLEEIVVNRHPLAGRI